MAICSDCEFCDMIDEEKGRCKKGSIERHIIPVENHLKEIIDGWPIVLLNEKACGEFVQTH